MPVVTVTMWQGRSKATKEALIAVLSAAVSKTLGMPATGITVVLQEIPRENWGENGRQCVEETRTR